MYLELVYWGYGCWVLTVELLLTDLFLFLGRYRRSKQIMLFRLKSHNESVCYPQTWGQSLVIRWSLRNEMGSSLSWHHRKTLCIWTYQLARVLNFLFATFFPLFGDSKGEKGLSWCDSVDWATSLRTKGLPVRLPVRAQGWVVGQVSSEGHARGNHTSMFLSLSFFPVPVLKNK